MKELSDEILNKYIDNELNTREINELKELLAANPELTEILKAQILLDDVLNELQYESAPPNFTSKVMGKLNVSYSRKSANNLIVKIVLSFFGVLSAGFLTAGILFVTSQSTESSPVVNKMNGFFDELLGLIPKLNFTLSNDTLLVIISTLALLILLSIYVFINSHRAFKQKIENLSH